MISIIITLLGIIFVHLADRYSDGGRKKIWVLGPIGIWMIIIYWVFRIILEFI